MRAAVQDIETGEITSESNREGELLINSEATFNRYLDRPDATAESFVTDSEGTRWFKTGDCAVHSSEHNSWKILGRLSQDIIKKSGYKISALEIEDVLLQTGKVKECAVVGVPNEDYGEEIVAFVVRNSGESFGEDALNKHCKELMSSYKVPRVYKFVDSLPRNGMGKVSKVELKKTLQ